MAGDAYVDFPSVSGHWHPWQEVRYRVSGVQAGWLRSAGSLTALLRSHSGGDFAVKVAEERWLFRDTGRLPLQRRGSAPLWSRKVVLRGAGEDWVMARTLIPGGRRSGFLRQVMGLHQRPLGELLFGPEPATVMGRWYGCSAHGIWGRRTLFCAGQTPVLVAEFFLDALLQPEADEGK